MIKLPFTIGPGVAKRWITEAGYIDGSFIICDNFDDLRDLLDTSKYRLQAGTPILINDYDKIYKYVEGESDISKLPHFDFFTDKLDPGTIYAWKAGAWYNLSEIFLHLATKEDLENLKKDLQDEFNRKYTELSNALNKEINDRENADLLLKQEIQTQLNTFQNNITNLEISLSNEVSRATQAEQKLQGKIEEEAERAIIAESALSQKVNDALTDLGGQYDSLFDDFNNFKQEYKTDQEEVDDKLNGLRNDLDNEITRSKDETNKLQDQLVEEVKRATAAEQTNQKLIFDEMRIRAEQDASVNQSINKLQDNLNQEIINRASADSNLQTSIDNEVERATNTEKDLQDQIDNLSTKVDDNQKRTQEALNELQEQIGEGFSAEKTIADEIGRLEEELNSSTSDLEQKIQDETTARETVDKTLQDNIDSEASTRQAADENLQKNIETEQARAEKAETDLDNKINDLESSNNEKFDGLQTALDAEVTRAKQAESDIETEVQKKYEKPSTGIPKSDLSSSLQDSIDKADASATNDDLQKEIERAKAAEKTNADAIIAEETRATAAEQANTDAINANKNAINANTDAIEAEVTRATAAEGDLTTLTTTDKTSLVAAINEEVNRAKAAEKKNADAIAAEAERAKGVEGQLSEQITDATASLNSLVETTKQDLEEEIQTSASEHTKINQRLDTIESKIPTQASSTNQLADKAFVNISIQANAARFLTPTAEGDSQWGSFDLLKSGPWYYEGKTTQPTNNDYAVFIKSEQESESGVEEQWRALFQKSDGEAGNWVEQYKMGSAFTNVQQEALDSGITKSLTGQITTNQTNITNLQTSLQDHIKDTADKYVKKVDPTFSGTMTPEVGSKIDFSQSTTNVRTPVANNEAANKKYVDDTIASNASSTLTSANEYTDNAIEGLDSSITEEENKYISAVTQTNGKITGTKKALPVTNIIGTDPISVSNNGSVYTVSHKEKNVTNSTSTGVTTFMTEVSADTTGHLSSYKTNTFEDALKALGVINIFGGTAADLK